MGEQADRTLRAAAEAVLRGGDAGGYTVPAANLYPHQWNWDSALCALGWAELDPQRAWTELETLLGARDAEGMIPHIAFRTHRRTRGLGGRFGRFYPVLVRPRARYLPGPRWWGRRHGADGRRISAITQPPLAATCARLLFERHALEQRARALLEPLARWHGFLLGSRDPLGLGEPTLIHPWESGRDNAVEWDRPLAQVEVEVRVVRRRDTAAVDAAERPSDDAYRRFLTLVRRGTLARWPQAELAREGPFRVLDPGFSAILARAAADLAWLAAELGEHELAERSSRDAECVAGALRARTGSDGLVAAVDLNSDTSLEDRGAGTALAALAPGQRAASVAAVRDLALGGRLDSEFGVRSLDRDHPQIAPRNYWRGPVWANVTWLTAHALALHGESEAAGRLRARMLDAARASGMREYFAPDSGRGLGAGDFGWTAALTLRSLAYQSTG